MRVRLPVVLISILVTGIGLITLLGLVVTDDFGTLGQIISLTPIRLIAQVFLRLAQILIALTLLIGILNLVFVNISRVIRGRTIGARLGSIVLLGSFLLVIFLRVLDSTNGTRNAPQLLETIQVPLGASLNSLLFFALVWGAFRILRKGITLGRVVFIAAVIVVLLGAIPFPALTPLTDLSNRVLRVPVNAGTTGILLGIGLATLVAGVRVIIGQDRQYGE